MFLTAGLFIIWALYYLNFQIVTDKRVVDIDQKTILRHVTSELNLEEVQDVSAVIKGIGGNFMNYGTVFVQTAGERENFEFENIPDPNGVAKLILDLQEKLKHEMRPK